MAYNQGGETAVIKPIAASGMPDGARSYYHDLTNFTYRPFVSTSEALLYLDTTAKRKGHFPIIVNTGGTLASGLITGGTNDEYWFKDGYADGNLVIKASGGSTDITAQVAALTPIYTNPLQAKALFTGYWYNDTKQGLSVFSTLNQGPYIQFYVNGTTSVSLKTVIDLGTTNLPILAVKIDGGSYTSFTMVAGVNTLSIATGLDSTVQHTVLVMVKSLDANTLKFTNVGAISINDVLADSGATFIPFPKTKVSIFYGDSITDGLNILNSNGNIGSNDATAAYPQIYGQLSNKRIIQHGFGGTGFLTAGNGSVPNTITNTFNYYTGNPINLKEDVAEIFINVGTNGTGGTIADQAAAYNVYIGKLKAYFPSAVIVMIIPLYFRSFPDSVAQFKAVATSNNILCIDTTNTIFDGITFTDLLHLTVAGNLILGTGIYTIFKSLTTGTSGGSSTPTFTEIGGVAVDLNTYITDGLFQQDNDAWAAAGTNYPEGKAGLLEVRTGEAELVYHRYTTYTNNLYIRQAFLGTFTPWKRLVAAGEGTPVTVITSEDLYTLSPGVYAQNNDAYLSSATHYPAGATSGVITIYSPSGSFKYLLYQDYNGKVFANGMLSGTYSGWNQLGGSSAPPEGDYTPSVGNLSNISNVTFGNVHYVRNGNTVNLFGSVTITPVAAGASSFDFSAAIGSNFSAVDKAIGGSNGGALPATIYANTTTHNLKLSFTAAIASAITIGFWVDYVVQ